ncbi:hypothetical protein RRV45_19655 [Bacillus sp. DTU_2020_1000418_1_SI_GHA_SEK_038]|uniref:hypothetical protein n=1 Tax=Bacillus sp. DTU_2020_1000418_1_SI_GHA_SEK_038 TaxID=3077585 RepID=UPI0028E368D6|nr:hypothetical protein [Bacillus sp. DTU_2020_1000418_1_SI_GHA_SEK_038]WNS75069.1 hypothetical protein RRV45_19655 [Bacillus sp. DTU_2020_1000418_1_SI_GHA_SEK_038]
MEKILYEILDQLKDHSKRFDKLDQRFDAVDERLDTIDHRLFKLEEIVQNNATEFRSHFKHIHSKLDQHEDAIRILSNN